MEKLNVALGTMHFGTKVPEDESRDLLDRFVDAGGTMLDTADCYSFWQSETGFGGQSEEVIGRWLADRPGMRERVYISTKVGAEPTVVGGFPEHKQGLSADSIARGIEGSLKRLGVDRVDLYWAHMEDRSADLAETVDAFGELVRAGTVDRLGVSNHPLWMVERARQLARAHGQAGYTAIQHSYSYLQQRPGTRIEGKVHRFGNLTDDMLDYVDSHDDMWAWAYTPLLEGAYSKPERLHEVYDHPGTTRRLAALDEVAAELGATRNQVVLAWLIGGTPSITPIVGVSNAAQLDEAMAGVSLTLSADQRARLDAAG
ncbi:aldo/keto reductase [Phytoactinopolyspora halotolerans]|uniref:Aldo/keto reductase n=1 Tax=Phytoactinopolyspora halotolerans TaxID=1981512 RepID=A0A6L9S3I7_9ACTN|nr:aldo/keto reductase [Phytoactinopolyspora halotolerans]NED99994.1 aldo/keto reductase [Phytoactinopolyspora halotolerans]